jgi:hypothetical protein
MAASTYLAQVQQLYIAYFGRPADPIGQAYWAGVIDAANGSIAAVQAGFAASTESQALYGNKSTIDKVTAIYQNVFNRSPDAAGLTYWVNQIESGKVTQAQASWTIQQNAGAGDAATVQNKLTAAQAFTANVDTAAEIAGYQGSNAAASARAFLGTVTSDNATATAAVAGAQAAVTNAAVGTPGTTFTLTTGVDAVVGSSNNDTIVAYVNTTAANTTSTLTAADTINGGAGVDTLALTVEGNVAGALPNATITNVEKFSIRDVATAASSYDFAQVQGETEVSSNVSTNTAGVTFANLGTGTVLSVQGNGSTTVANVNFNYATATDAVNLVLNGGLKGTTAVTANAGTATTATITSSGAANTVGALALAGATANSITALTINAVTDLTATLTATDFASTGTLTVTGAGKVNVGNGFDGAVINASANTGGLTATTTTGVTSSVIGSAGADVITVAGTLTTTGSINLGAGDDKLLSAAGSIVATNTIDGGAGFDTVAASLINVTNAAKFVNFEAVDLSSNATLDLALVTGSTITALTLSGGTGITNVSNVNTGVGLSVSGNNTGSSVIGVKNAATTVSDTFGITFNGTADASATALAKTAIGAGAITVDNVEIVNIVSGGTGFVANSLTLADSNLKTLAITGSQDLTLAFGTTGGTSSATVGVSLIDGSAATGKLSINATGINTLTTGATIKTGSADDSITVGASGGTVLAGNTLTGGAGKDTFTVTAAVYGANKIITTITDFTSADNVITGAAAGAAVTKITLGAGITTLDLALGATTNAAGIQWFQYGGDTYVVNNFDTTAGAGATDVVVKLSGLVDLTGAAVTAAGLHTAA